MTIEVHLFATLVRYLPPGTDGARAVLDVPDGSTVHDVARLLGIPDTLARLALVNGREADPGERLTATDVLTLFPPLAGGATPRLRAGR